MKISIKEIISRKGALAENEVKDLLNEYNIKTTKYQVVSEITDLDNLNLDYSGHEFVDKIRMKMDL